RRDRRAAPRRIEHRPLEAGAQPSRAHAPRLEAQPAARILLDQIVGVVDRHDRREGDGAAAYAERELAAAPLIGVEERVAAQRLDPQPPRQLLPVRVVDDPDMTGLVAADDAPRDVVARQLAFQPLLQPIGLVGVEPLADQRLQIGAQRLGYVAIGDARDLDAIDQVAVVDVVLIAPLPHDEGHPGLSIAHDGSRGRHVAGPLGLDARRELVEPRLFHWRADERADVLTKTWTEPADVEAADVDRADGGAVGHRRPLIG